MVAIDLNKLLKAGHDKISDTNNTQVNRGKEEFDGEGEVLSCQHKESPW